MKIPDVKIGDIINIGEKFTEPKAQVVRVYSAEEKSHGLCGDAEVVYYQHRIKGIKEDVVWDKEGEFWHFENDALGGAYVDINQYPKLKK